MGLENWDLNAAAENVSADILPRLNDIELEDEERAAATQLLGQFNVIAADMIQKSPGLEMPGAAQPIEWDEEHAMQALSLFAEGIYYAVVRCHNMRIPPEISNELLQTMALDVYNQAIQVVASTYGQELTPEYQFSQGQQVEFIQKGGESALIYYVNEYERQHGPIHPEEEESPNYEDQATYEQNPPETDDTNIWAEEEPVAEPEALPEPVAEAPAPPPPPPKKAPPAKPAPKSAPDPKDKYAAVALLLTTLKADKRKKIIANFNEKERELIAYYSYPQHLEGLDVANVKKHLQTFKELLQNGGSSLKSGAYKGIEDMAKALPAEKLLSLVQEERPKVRQYLARHYESDESLLPGEGIPAAPQPAHLAEFLPPRVEEILFRHLGKRIKTQAQLQEDPGNSVSNPDEGSTRTA